jgi:Spy/CpxP family protein refolding chaperone
MKAWKRIALWMGLLVVAGADAATPAPSAYAGQESRDIKALAPDDVSALLEGMGMGLAKAAELNGYPGPAHVLELADRLRLSAEQRQRTEALFATMQEQAIAAGTALVAEERRLDRLFADRTATAGSLTAALARIGALQAQVRGIHLDAHLAQVRILTPEQTMLYGELRGYGSTAAPDGHRMRHRH